MIIEQATKSSFTIDFISGGLAGLIGKILICPIDKLKILLQTKKFKDSDSKYKQTFIYLKNEINQKGLLNSLWIGKFTSFSKYIVNQAINFGVKGQIENIINRNNKLLIGGLTGALSSLVLYPFDLAEVRILTDKKNKYQKGLIDCLIKVYKQEGKKDLFLGLSANILGNFCYRSLYFGLYDIGCKYIFGKKNFEKINCFKNIDKKKLLLKKFMLAQGVSLLSETLIYPLDTIRKRIMIGHNEEDNEEKEKNKQYKSETFIDCIKKIYKDNNSIRGFYNGLLINSFRTVGSSFVLLTYQIINDKIKQKKIKY